MHSIITLALLCNLQILHEYSALENFWKRYNKVCHKQDYQLKSTCFICLVCFITTGKGEVCSSAKKLVITLKFTWFLQYEVTRNIPILPNPCWMRCQSIA